jgi:hypothetical protein
VVPTTPKSVAETEYDGERAEETDRGTGRAEDREDDRAEADRPPPSKVRVAIECSTQAPRQLARDAAEPVRGDRIGKSLELERLGPYGREFGSHVLVNVAVYHHLTRPSLRFEAGRQVHDVADRSVVPPIGRAESADPGPTGSNAD